jgi:hypothetical protein
MDRKRQSVMSEASYPARRNTTLFIVERSDGSAPAGIDPGPGPARSGSFRGILGEQVKHRMRVVTDFLGHGVIAEKAMEAHGPRGFEGAATRGGPEGRPH